MRRLGLERERESAEINSFVDDVMARVREMVCRGGGGRGESSEGGMLLKMKWR